MYGNERGVNRYGDGGQVEIIEKNGQMIVETTSRWQVQL